METPAGSDSASYLQAHPTHLKPSKTRTWPASHTVRKSEDSCLRCLSLPCPEAAGGRGGGGLEVVKQAGLSDQQGIMAHNWKRRFLAVHPKTLLASPSAVFYLSQLHCHQAGPEQRVGSVLDAKLSVHLPIRSLGLLTMLSDANVTGRRPALRRLDVAETR